MSADPAVVETLCDHLSRDLVENFIGRLDPAYLNRFQSDDVVEHLNRLSQLSASRPVDVIITPGGDRSGTVTVLAFDHAFEFSLITGVLAGMGFRIDSGDVFTLSRKASEQRVGRDPRAMRRHMRAAPVRDPLHQPVIIDCFSGGLWDESESFDSWAGHAEAAMVEVIGLLDKGDDDSAAKAKHLVNEMVTRRLKGLEATARPGLFPVDLDISQINETATRLKIVAQDTPAFLYSLSTALSLHGLSIHQVRIRSEEGRAIDEIDVVDRNGKPIVDEQLIERVKLSVLLTKQFTYFLGTAPDPFTALERFEKLTEDLMRGPERGQWLDMLRDPATMKDLAKLLGASDYLWEDFIRSQYETLIPILGPQVKGRWFSQSAETLPYRLQQHLKGAVGLAQQQDRVNQFKDRETFQIDLDHILNPGFDFRELSARLTLLAENLIATAAKCVYDDLVNSYGEPQIEKGREGGYAIFGLGKLGGIALGYASDVELLFVYAANPRDMTRGGKRKSISNAEFFEQLAQEMARFIRTKREGIFQVDMRLRPYGKESPLACTASHFREYYGTPHEAGGAHSFEKLALVRLRWIAGDSKLGFDIEQLRDNILYERNQIDLDALWDLLGRARKEKMAKGGINAKYSPGALSDLEGTVQLLQVMNGNKAPQLRTPRLTGAMEGLRRAGVLEPKEFAELYGAYKFLRRLINALRMLRGNAQDLFLPDQGADELIHLARRMDYVRDEQTGLADQLMAEFESRTAQVRSFVERHFGRPCPGC